MGTTRARSRGTLPRPLSERSPVNGPDGIREWLVGGGIVASDDGVLLVQNRRRDGRLDWSPPGGVIDPGETLLDGLTREVAEETGLVVAGWEGPAYEISAEAPDMGWRLAVEAHVAVGVTGELGSEDPDGIVVAARYLGADECAGLLTGAPRWVAEPLLDLLAEPSAASRRYRYRVDGTLAGRDIRVARLDDRP
ncbi:hypothetical protein BH24ACT4_BH24ACT4_00700 [soil metagenome]